jgi:P pilus assembly chaperone PapD
MTPPRGRRREGRGNRCLAALLGALGILVCSTPRVSAQSVEVSPLRVELATRPGDTHTQAVTLTNQGSDPVRVRARVRDWFVSRDGTPQFDAALPEPERPFMASAWVRLAPPEQVIQPGQQGIVRFTTMVPADTIDGGYRAAILMDFGPAGAAPIVERRSVQFRSRVATLLYVAVGKPPVAIEMVDLASRVSEDQPSVIVATLRNTGRAAARTTGTVLVRDGAGQTVRTLKIPNVPVLPMAERELAIPTAGEGEDTLPRGEYRIEIRLDVGMPELLVGETTLRVVR